MARRVVIAFAGIALLSAAFVGVFLPTTEAQQSGEGFRFCGQEDYGVGLRFHNKDLNPWNDPPPADDHPYHDTEFPYDPTVTESSWEFFIQFQAVVDQEHTTAQEMDLENNIKSFWFAFGPVREAAMIDGPTDQGPGDNCAKPWLPGFQLYSYRGDADPSDGFFVPINTTGVPDLTYGAAVYACTAQEFDACQPGGEGENGGNPNLVAAAWTRATVYNGEDQCADADNEYRCKRQFDFIDPWPLVLPGDGEGFTQPYADACDSGSEKRCVTVEFAEDLDTINGSAAPEDKAIRVWLNGIERTGDLQIWEDPPQRDNDLILGNDGEHTGHPLSDCSTLDPVQQISGQIHSLLRLCQKVVWGDAFALDLDRELSPDDEIRIWAMDGAGNEVEKTISFEDETRGGVIELIEADIGLEVTPKEQAVRPGDAKTYTVTITNEGNDTAHTFPKVDADPEVDAQLSDDHVDIPGNGKRNITLTAGPKTNASEGDYSAEVRIEYLAQDPGGTQTRRQSESTFVTVTADESASLSGSDGSDDDGSESVPGGFERDCSTQGEHHVCFLYPGNLSAGEEFTFQVKTQQAAETVEQRHDVSVGEADLTIQYLSEDGSESVADDETYPMTETDKGSYEADVTLAEVSPMVHAIFDAEKVRVTKMIHQASDTGPQSAGQIPGFGVAALVAAGAAALWIRRRDRSRGRSP